MISPAGSDECGTNLGKNLVRPFPDYPSWESQHPIPSDPQRVLPLHVGPPFLRIGVLATVHLDVYAPRLVERVKIPAMAIRVVTNDLTCWIGQAATATEPEIVELAHGP